MDSPSFPLARQSDGSRLERNWLIAIADSFLEFEGLSAGAIGEDELPTAQPHEFVLPS